MQNVFVTVSIRPICLTPEEIAVDNITGHTPSVAGWGTTVRNQRMYIFYYVYIIMYYYVYIHVYTWIIKI